MSMSLSETLGRTSRHRMSGVREFGRTAVAGVVSAVVLAGAPGPAAIAQVGHAGDAISVETGATAARAGGLPTHDQMFGGEFERTTALVPNASLALFPGETHMVPVERRKAVAARVQALLSPHSP